jgi:hypothetical protein
MTKLAMPDGSNNTDIQLNEIILNEFQDDSSNLLQIPPPSSTSTEADYQNLFSDDHLQIINSLNFGTPSVQQKTRGKHAIWMDLHRTTELDDDHIKQAKAYNTTIKKSVVSRFATNLENMYMDGKIFYKAVDLSLYVLLQHLRPEKERNRRERLNEHQKVNEKKTSQPEVLTRKS